VISVSDAFLRRYAGLARTQPQRLGPPHGATSSRCMIIYSVTRPSPARAPEGAPGDRGPAHRPAPKGRPAPEAGPTGGRTRGNGRAGGGVEHDGGPSARPRPGPRDTDPLGGLARPIRGRALGVSAANPFHSGRPPPPSPGGRGVKAAVQTPRPARVDAVRVPTPSPAGNRTGARTATGRPSPPPVARRAARPRTGHATRPGDPPTPQKGAGAPAGTVSAGPSPKGGTRGGAETRGKRRKGRSRAQEGGAPRRRGVAGGRDDAAGPCLAAWGWQDRCLALRTYASPRFLNGRRGAAADRKGHLRSLSLR